MRTNKKYQLKESIAIIMQYLISRFSLWYFQNINKSRITLVRKQGIGDCIFATGPLEVFKNRYPDTNVKLVASYPQVFDHPATSDFSWRDFPLVWMMYEHYDFSWLKGKDKHIHDIIATHLGMPDDQDYSPRVTADQDAYGKLNEKYVQNNDYILIQPWAGGWNQNRNWSKKHWERLVSELVSKGERVFQIGTSKDEPIAGAENLCGETSLVESLLLVQHSKIFIGVNSFGEQAAGAFHIPSVILYGATNPIYSLNLGQVAVFADHALAYPQLDGFDYQFYEMEEIDFDLVMKQVNSTLMNLQAR